MQIEAIFWVSLFFINFTYIGYPVFLYALSRIYSKPVCQAKDDFQPFVSIVLAAKNEALGIEERLKNLLVQDYPADKYEIIIVSDGSIDETDGVVQNFIDSLSDGQEQIFCYAYTPSQGKPTALNIGIEHARGEIIVFADTRQRFAQNTVSRLVRNFADPAIGAVSGELVFLQESDSAIKAQMGVYWKYEKTVRKLESLSGSVVGATGAIYAIRKQLYQPLPRETILDDVLTPMNIVMQGYRVIFDGQAVAYDTISRDAGLEWKRKVRTLAGNWQLISLRTDLLNPRKNTLLFRFCAHKLARLVVPLFLMLLLTTSALQQGIFWVLITSVQLLVYILAGAAWFFPGIQRIGMLKTIYFFCLLNIAAVAGFIVWITGGCSTIWSAGGHK